MTGSLEAKRPHADFSTALWVWYQEGSHLYKQRWSFLLSVYKSAKTVFFFFLAILMKMSPWNFQFLDLYRWIHQIQLGFIYFFDIQKQQRFENSASDRLNNLLPPSLVIGSDFAAVTFTAAEMGLKFTRIWANLQQIPSRLSLHLVLSEARGLGVGARGLRGDRRGSQAAAEILIASLGFSLDPITLSGPGRRPVSLGSGYSTHTQKHTLTHSSQRFEHHSPTRTDGDGDVQYKCAPTYSCAHTGVCLDPRQPADGLDCKATVRECFGVQLRLSARFHSWILQHGLMWRELKKKPAWIEVIIHQK